MLSISISPFFLMTCVRSISSCLICRFILNLRSVHFSEGSASTVLASTVKFASPSTRGKVTTSLVGNIGAPLAIHDDCGYSEDVIYLSDDPFSFELSADSEPGSNGLE